MKKKEKDLNNYIQEIKKIISDLSPINYSKDHQYYIEEMITTCLKLLSNDHETWQLKLINRALKEIRYAYTIFNKSHGSRKISIFGSARTPEDHPDYKAAETLANQMSKKGWMAISGAAHGIMQATVKGATPSSSFGLSIHLPYEKTVTSLIEGDPKLINFRYFFTRKLIFAGHSDAFAAFPGGFGTQDEVFEVLTLMQTGKAPIVPIILIEGSKGVYWKYWEQYIIKNFLNNGWINPEDMHLFFLAPSVKCAIQQSEHFYKRYHSSRYVKDIFVIRLKSTLTPKQITLLNDTYSPLVYKGNITLSNALPEENDYLNLPRLIFHHTRKKFGMIRQLIDQINTFQ